MAKRGRPKTTGESGTIRVPKDFYLMVHWVADAMRTTSTMIADRYLRSSLTELYLSSYFSIAERQKVEVEAAHRDGREPVPVPRLLVRLLPRWFDTTYGSELRPENVHPEGKLVFFLDEIPVEVARDLAAHGCLVADDQGYNYPYNEDHPAPAHLRTRTEQTE